jgi:hypothetical protein
MIWLPSSTQTQPISSHPSVVTDSHPSETQPISSHPDPADITNKPVDITDLSVPESINRWASFTIHKFNFSKKPKKNTIKN